MIHRVLLKKYIGQSSLLFLSCGAALFAFAWIRVWVVSLLDMGQFQTILEQFREFEKFAPIEFDSLFTYTGRVGMTFDEPIVILCIVIWCISRGSDVVSGELGRGTLEMVLSQPISRTQLLLSHATVSILGLALLSLLVWAGVGAGVYATSVEETVPPPTVRIPIIGIDIPLTVDQPQTQTLELRDRVDVQTYAASTFHLFSFGYFVLGLATFFSSIDRYRWRTVGATVAFYILQMVMFGLGKAAESLSYLLSMTFFSCYKPQKMTSIVTKEGLAAPWTLTHPLLDMTLPPLVYPLILLGLGTTCYVGAVVCFNKRDLPAPL
ncbi:ABC transporter permease subunit [Novipirellula artificiosorum]|uniref:ABC-2 family transporter protein n=1 Tax=Novipirellula artificiosorum TaxID=2528016 RepID=A0A5C6DKA0_9BACT|nr:ABC transporter permease subunit [Novipirellula artificiosorum]TWU36041.1 ABC-2 family transporter protein [Novipirellula artificiosorum]